MNEEQSEFGAGIVVCLAKFSEHLWNEWDPTMRRDGRADRLLETEIDIAKKVYPEDDPEARAFSSLVERWANGASDHFYDLDEKAPPALKELASLTLGMGHGFTGRLWTEEDVDRIRALWKQACLEVDGMLGVKSDWGQW